MRKDSYERMKPIWLEWSPLNTVSLREVELLTDEFDWICSCGETWRETIASRGNPVTPGCFKCRLKPLAPKARYGLVSERPDLLEFWDFARNSEGPEFLSARSGKRAFWLCSYGHSFTRVVNSFQRSPHCSLCNKPETEEEWERFLQKRYGFGKAFLEKHYVAEGMALDSIWRAHGPGHGVLRRALQAFGLKRSPQESLELREKARIATWIELYGEYRPAKHISSPSLPEFEVAEALKTLGFAFIHQEKNLIAPKELDFVLIDYPIALEYNGLHWHDRKGYEEDLRRGTITTRERLKESLCSSKGLKLVHLWEDDWHAATDKSTFLLDMMNLTRPRRD